MSRRALVANSLWITLRYVIVSLSGLVISLAFARLSTKETFGQYQFVIALLATFSALSLPGLNMAALKGIAQKNFGAVLDTVRWSFRASWLAVPPLLVYAFYLAAHGQGELGLTIGLAALLFPFFYAPNTWYVFYEGQSIFRPVAIRTTLSAVGVMAAVLLAIVLKLHVLWLILIYFSVSVIFTTYFYLEVRKKIAALPVNNQKGALDLRYGLGVSGQKFAYTLSESLPPLVISFLLGHVAVANFQAASLFLGAMAGFIGALAALTLPKLFAEIDSHHQHIFLQNVVIGLVAALGYWLIVRLAFRPLYGAAYQESYQLALSLTVLPLFISLRTFLVNYFTAQEKNGFIVIVYLLANAVALMGFYLATKQSSFVFAASLYLYVLNIFLLIPLLARYGFGVLKNYRRQTENPPL